MNNREQNQAVEAAKEILLAARAHMADMLQTVFQNGMSLRYRRGKKKDEEAVADLIYFNAETNTLTVRKGHSIESIDAVDVVEILEPWSREDKEEEAFVPNAIRLQAEDYEDD